MRWNSLLTIYWIRKHRIILKSSCQASPVPFWLNRVKGQQLFFVLFLHYCNRNNNNKRSTETVWNRAGGASGSKQGRWAMRAVSRWAVSLFDAAACQVFLERNQLEIICYAKTQEALTSSNKLWQALTSSDRLSGCPPCHISHSLLISSPNHRTTWPVLEGLLTSAISVGQICTVACYEGKRMKTTLWWSLMWFAYVCVCEWRFADDVNVESWFCGALSGFPWFSCESFFIHSSYSSFGNLSQCSLASPFLPWPVRLMSHGRQKFLGYQLSGTLRLAIGHPSPPGAGGAFYSSGKLVQSISSCAHFNSWHLMRGSRA